MELRKFKEKNPKKVGIILFTITCILLISGVILYRTFAIFQVDTTQNVINGSIEDPGDIYFAFYKDGNIQKEMPRREDGYILDEQESYCGVNGTNVDSIKVFMTEDEVIHVSGVATSRTKCNLYFVKGVYILGKGIPFETESDGLYEVTHENVTGTINDTGFQKTEYRYSGSDPDNYITFNNEDWRIIGLVNVMTSNNNVEQRVKIIRNESIQNVQWNDKTDVNDWNKASLMKLLNTGDYYNRKNDYETIGLTENAREKIDEKIIWNIGGYNTPNILTNDMYKYERSINVFETNNYLWQTDNHGVALMYSSDYGYAVGGSNENRTKCVIQTLLSNYNTCTNKNWLYDKNNSRKRK